MRVGSALAAAALLAGCGGGGRHEGDRRGVGRDEVLAQVTASGTADNRPDEARFSVGVTSIDASAQGASAANGRKMNAVVTALRGLGVAERDIQTRQLTIQRIDYGPNRGRFEANNVANVRLRAIDKAGEAIAAATAAGANILSGPDLRVGDPEAAGRSAYAAAYRAARARADAYAEAAGLKVARVLTIRDGQAPTYGGDFNAMAEETRQAAPPVVAPPVLAGTSTSQATVSVEFALGPR